jgi:hypothetical protein
LNRGGHGGAIISINEGSGMVISNCLLAGNKALYGGGMNLGAGGVVTFINSTIVYNQAPFMGGGIFNEDCVSPGHLDFRNGIAWGNTPDQILTMAGCTTTVAYACVEGGHTGPSNISDDPQFAGGPSGTWTAHATYQQATGQTTFTDTTAGWLEGELVGKTLNPDIAQYRQSLIVGNTAGTVTAWGNFSALGSSGTNYQVHNYRPSTGSPCIDAADNGFVHPDMHDLNTNGDTDEPIPFDLGGNLRFVNHPFVPDTGNGTPPVVDMGAYENQGLSGDFDGDGDVDLDDYAFQGICMTGPGSAYGPGDACLVTDLDADADVDLRDFGGFQVMLFPGP